MGTSSDQGHLSDELIATLVAEVDRRLSQSTSATSSAIADVSARSATERKSNQRIVLGGGASIISAIIMMASWSMDKAEQWERQQATIAAHTQALDRIEFKLRHLSGRQKQLSQEGLDRTESLYDAIVWLGMKIDAISSRAKAIDMPESVEKMRKQRIDPVFMTGVD